jgi:hypothetical protein
MAHSPDKSGMIEKLGAQAVIADGLDGEAVRKAVRFVRPEAVFHEKILRKLTTGNLIASLP